MALEIKSAIRQTKPKGITKIGTIPQPDGTQVLLISGESKITSSAPIEITTLPKKPKARYFSTELVDSASDLPEEALLGVDLLAILLEYWLGWRKMNCGNERGSYANRTREVL